MAETTIDRVVLPTHSFDWGAIKWLVSPSTTRKRRARRESTTAATTGTLRAAAAA